MISSFLKAISNGLSQHRDSTDERQPRQEPTRAEKQRMLNVWQLRNDGRIVSEDCFLYGLMGGIHGTLSQVLIVSTVFKRGLTVSNTGRCLPLHTIATYNVSLLKHLRLPTASNVLGFCFSLLP